MPLNKKERQELIEKAEAAGLVLVDKDTRPGGKTVRIPDKVKGGKVRLGIVSDTHFGSCNQQITALEQFVKEAQEFAWGPDSHGVDYFFHAGDLIDGTHHMHRDHLFSNFKHGFDAQVRYAAEAWPRTKVPTYLIDGNHDDSYFQNVGATPGAWLAELRDDIRYAGYHSAFIEVGGLRALIQHGAMGGAAYARSYKVQKLVEQLDNEERARTQMAFYGHWHYFNDVGLYQGMLCYNVACFQSQTRFLRRLGLQPATMGLAIEVEVHRDGRIDVTEKKRWYPNREHDHEGGDFCMRHAA